MSAQVFPVSASFSGGVRTPTVKRELLVLEPGDHVTHDKYGTGRVEEVLGEGEAAMSVVDFGKAGRVKALCAAYVKRNLRLMPGSWRGARAKCPPVCVACDELERIPPSPVGSRRAAGNAADVS